MQIAAVFLCTEVVQNVMANEKNLIPFDKRTESEQRKIAQKGGKKSGESRRKKKTIKAMLSIIMDKAPDEKNEKRLQAAGYDESEINNQLLMLVKVVDKAISKGDMRAVEFIRDMQGENPWVELKKAELELKKQELEMKRKLAEESKNLMDSEPVIIIDDISSDSDDKKNNE